MKKYKSIFTEAKTKLDLELANKILEWLMKNPYPEDSDFHKFSEDIGVDTHKLEAQAYAILSDIITGGKSKGVMPKDADEKEIDMGMKVEVEHCSIPFIQNKIVSDHIADNPKYYSEGKNKGIFDELE